LHGGNLQLFALILSARSSFWAPEAGERKLLKFARRFGHGLSKLASEVDILENLSLGSHCIHEICELIRELPAE
jgi:hypothetical protein